MRRDVFERDARLALRLAGGPSGDEPAEALVAGPVFNEQSQARRMRTGGLGDGATG
jgi:hypothetical protein